MKAFATPRLWIYIWSGLGAAFLLYIIVSAASQPGGQTVVAACKVSVKDRHPSFLVGDMADFTYAFPPRQAPTAAFQKDDVSLSLADFRGKTILVNFWATWCPPCLKELPSLNALQGALGSDKFEVVAVAADPKGPEEARKYLDRLNINNLTLYTDERLRLASSVGSGAVLPVSILYSPEGAEVGRLVGEADWSGEAARRLVSNAIDCL